MKLKLTPKTKNKIIERVVRIGDSFEDQFTALIFKLQQYKFGAFVDLQYIGSRFEEGKDKIVPVQIFESLTSWQIIKLHEVITEIKDEFDRIEKPKAKRKTTRKAKVRVKK